MSRYIVKSNLEHDGDSFKPGDEAEIDDKAAAILVRDGVVAGNGDTPPVPEEKTVPDVEPDGATDTTSQPDTTTGDPSAFENLSYADLQERAKAHGLKYTGVKKDDLIESIKAAEAAKQPENTSTDGNAGAGSDTGNGDPNANEDIGANL